jgi:hypothetical protein
MARPDVFSVPRRFDLATLLVAMAAFAALFGTLLMMNAPPDMLAFLGGLFALVAAAQWLAAKWNCPRTASAIAGILFYWAAYIAEALSHSRNWINDVVIQMIPAALVGSVGGYVAGALVGGIFLASHYLREWLGRGERSGMSKSAESESPWEASESGEL